jgi:hypothetical protein
MSSNDNEDDGKQRGTPPIPRLGELSPQSISSTRTTRSATRLNNSIANVTNPQPTKTSTAIQYVPLVATTNQKFTDYKTNELLTKIKQFLPCGKLDWEHIAKEINKLDGVRVRLYDNLPRKFNATASS